MAVTEEGNIAGAFLLLTVVGSIAFGFAMSSIAWGVVAFCAILIVLFTVRL